MASGPITSWEIDGETVEIDGETVETDGETVETVADFIFMGSKITADGDCSYETERCFLLGQFLLLYYIHLLQLRQSVWESRVDKTKIKLKSQDIFVKVDGIHPKCPSWNKL